MAESLSLSTGDASSLHVAIIMDGNGRWARARGMPRTFGHKEGAKAVRRTIEASQRLGITHLTLFGFSSENWLRPESEVSELMGLLRFYLRREVADLHKNNVRFKVIGNREKLPSDIVDLIEGAEDLTGANSGLVVTVALSYGGREELTRSLKKIAEDVEKGGLNSANVTPELISDKLDTRGLPDPDLLIRTSGEKRISNFLLWQMAYAEMLFLDVLWPDFDYDHLKAALDEFSSRERRFGRATG